MKRKILILMFLTLAIVATACSTREEFIIVNNSDADLIVEYSYKDKQRIIFKPRTTSADKLTNEGQKWKEVSNEDFDVEEYSRLVKVKLSAKTAMLIFTADNYAGHDKEDFDIEMISLSGSSGDLKFVDKEAQTQFKKQDNGNYVIFYK